MTENDFNEIAKMLNEPFRDVVKRIKEENKKLRAFKAYFDSLYGQGLDIANWHKNGDLEPFDNFYDSAVEEMEGES